MNKTYTWELTLRLTHIVFITGVVICFISAKTDLLPFHYHLLGGSSVLVALIVRIIMGCLSPYPASLFRNFVTFRISTILQSIRETFTRKVSGTYGHSPLGGMAVAALITLLTLQTLTGLFITHTDDVGINDYPISGWLANTSFGQNYGAIAYEIHDILSNLLLLTIGLHLLASLFYLFIKRENLYGAMVTGYKWVKASSLSESVTQHKAWTTSLVFILTLGLVMVYKAIF